MANKKQKIIIIIIIIAIIIVILKILDMINAKNISSISGSGSGEIATMICKTEVVPHNSSRENINPYCVVTVKNYDENNNISQTGVDYTVTIEPVEGQILPDYYCVNSEGQTVADSLNNIYNITGTLNHTQIEEDEYTVYFINSGEANFTQNFNFKTNAVQQRNDEE